MDAQQMEAHSPTKDSSTDLASPTTIASPRSINRRKLSSPQEPFPSFDSDETASSVDSKLPIPRTTLLSSSIHRPGLGGSSPSLHQRGESRDTTSSQQPKSESDRTDALWAEMQATLADVESSASRGTHFFGAAHSAALEDLRNAQIELAKSWARGESEDHPSEPGRRRGETDSDADSSRSPGASLKSPDEEGVTANRDIEAAQKRREANDRYFYGIQQGVLDVVDKLEGVALAMGKVERQSRDIWAGSESEDLDSSSETNQL